MRYAKCPGLSVVQTGTAGQFTSVFMRGLPSQDMQVLLDGIPINQGLAGQFDFANLTTDDIDRIEVVRGPQSTIYGPRALAGVIQIFTKQGERDAGNYGERRRRIATTRFANRSQSDGKIGAVSITRSARAGSIPTTRVRTINIATPPASRTLAGRLTTQLRIGSLFTYSLSDTGNPNTIFDPRPIRSFPDRKMAHRAACRSSTSAIGGSTNSFSVTITSGR